MTGFGPARAKAECAAFKIRIAGVGEDLLGRALRGRARVMETSQTIDLDVDAPQARRRGEARAGRKKNALSVGPTSWFGPYRLPIGAQSETYAPHRFTASGGAGPYRFTSETGDGFATLLDPRRRLPPGLRLEEATGRLSGAPRRGGSYRFSVQAGDESGRSGESEFNLAVRLDLDQYAAYFDVQGAARSGEITRFDPDAKSADGDPVLPLTLCEFLAYKSAQAYMGDDPFYQKEYLPKELRRTHPNGEVTHFAFFDSSKPLWVYSDRELKKRKSTPIDAIPQHWKDFDKRRIEALNRRRWALDAQGFGFVFEGRVFIICRGATSLRDWRVDIDNGLTTDPPRPNTFWRNIARGFGLRSKSVNLTPEERILIGGPDPERYLQPARAIGFAGAWAAIRDQVENWLSGVPQAYQESFVFSGHSLGGAMALIGAEEFAEKRGRRIHAVVTFGAPCVGKSRDSVDRAAADAKLKDKPGPQRAPRPEPATLGAPPTRAKSETEATTDQAEDHFVDRYRRLQGGALEKRTIRLETSTDVVPKLMLAKDFDHVGQGWEIEFPPLPSGFALFTRRFITGPILHLARAGLRSGPLTLSNLPRRALGYTVFYAAPFLGRTMAAHGAYHRYALFLSTLSYRKLRAANLGPLEALDPQKDPLLPEKYAIANSKFEIHLNRIYGPRDWRRIEPRRIHDATRELRLARRHYGERRARYIF